MRQRSALTPSRMMVAACAALVSASSRKRRSSSATRLRNWSSDSCETSRPSRANRSRACARPAVSIASDSRSPLWILRVLARIEVPIWPGITTEHLMCGALIRRSVISASVNPLTANFAAEWVSSRTGLLLLPSRAPPPGGSISVASRDARLHYDPMAPAIKASAPIEALAGVVERVTFHNGENGFCVLRVKARGQRDLITILGHAAMVSAGEFVQASGSWINDRTHGVQFRASFLKATPPTTTEGIEKYLGSGMIRGIGPIYARKLVRAFSDAVFDVIEQEPGRLREVTGIGPKRAERIVAGWAEQKVIREIMLFLHSNGVGTSRAVRIYKTYGAEAVQRISENPYRLARDIRGIGYALTEAMNEGHCGLPAETLVPATAKLLEVPAELVEEALHLELGAGTVIADDLDGRRCVFLAGLYRAEREIAEKLAILALGKPP